MQAQPAIYTGPRRDLEGADATIRPQQANPERVWAQFYRVWATELCQGWHDFAAADFEALSAQEQQT